MSLQTQYQTATQDGTFRGRVLQAAVTAAGNISSEASTIGVPLKSGAIASLPITPALAAPIAANAVIEVGLGTSGVEFVTAGAAGASAGATTIPLATSQTLANNHPATDVISPPTDSHHAKRIAFALAVLNNPSGYAEIFAQYVAAQAVDNTATDITIQNTVNAGWNAISGAAT